MLEDVASTKVKSVRDEGAWTRSKKPGLESNSLREKLDWR